MMRALVTGFCGFIGSYVVPILREHGYEVLATTFRDLDRPIDTCGLHILRLDIRDSRAVLEVVGSWKPDLIVHLAAQSLVMPSWDDPVGTVDTNVLGTLHVLEGVRRSGLDPLFLFAGTSAQYGLNYDHEIPIREDKEFRPTSPYAASKVGADALTYAYCMGLSLRAIRMRLFNITGPGKVGDACADFAQGIAHLERQGGGILQVGSLDTIRDILDVRDAARAILTLVERGVAGEAYNICSGRGIRIRKVLELLLAQARAPIEVRHAKRRPADEPVFSGDNAKLRMLGWMPRIPIEQTLSDTLDYWRRQL